MFIVLFFCYKVFSGSSEKLAGAVVVSFVSFWEGKKNPRRFFPWQELPIQGGRGWFSELPKNAHRRGILMRTTVAIKSFCQVRCRLAVVNISID